MVTYPYVYMTYIVSPLAGLGGAYRGGRPPTLVNIDVNSDIICRQRYRSKFLCAYAVRYGLMSDRT